MASILDILGLTNQSVPPNMTMIPQQAGVLNVASTLAPGEEIVPDTGAARNPGSASAVGGSGVLSQGGGASPGILDQLGIKTDNFAGRLGNALIAGGSRDPGSTLLNLQKADNEAAAANKPKVTPLADGAFSLISFPDGTTKIVKNEDVAKFLGEQNNIKFLQGLVKAQVTADAGANAGNNKATFKADLEQAGGPGAPTTYRDSVTTQIGKIDTLITALPELDKVKTAIGGLDSPVAANIIDQTWGRITGSNDYSLRRDLESIVGEDVLKLAEKMKGALSDKDVLFLKSIQPKPDDPTDRKITYLTELKKRLDEGEKRRMEAAVRISGQGGNQSSPVGSPKTSGGVVSVTNEQEWQALPPGTVYKDPNGVVRTKK